MDPVEGLADLLHNKCNQKAPLYSACIGMKLDSAVPTEVLALYAMQYRCTFIRWWYIMMLS